MNYEVILGQTLHEAILYGWGYKYLYLWHETTTTQVNLKDHFHCDVTHMPMEEFDSALYENLYSLSEENKKICGCVVHQRLI